MTTEFDNAVENALAWVASELPEELRLDSFARNHYKHGCNLIDALTVLEGRASDVLDIGSGIGVFPTAMARLGHAVTSVDITSDNQPWIKERDVEVGNCNILSERLPCGDASFDLVTMFDVIEHLHGSPRHMLSEVYRVLRPGGHVIVETPNIANLRRRLLLLMGKNPMTIKYFYESPYPYSGHVYEYTKYDLDCAVRWSGFEIAESKLTNVLLHYHKIESGFAPGMRIQGVRDVAMLLYLAICRVVPSFRDTLLCIGRRPS